MKQSLLKKLVVGGLFAAVFFGSVAIAASTGIIDPNNIGDYKAAFYDNSVVSDPSINFGKFTTESQYNITVSDTALSGYAWGSSVGWIEMNCAETTSGCSSTNGNFKVANDGTGKLSGYAWGQNTGWINFGPFTDTSVSTVKIDSSTGNFEGTLGSAGYAWSQNYGWIVFDCTNAATCVNTNWRPASTGNQGGVSGGSSSTGQGGSTSDSITIQLNSIACSNESSMPHWGLGGHVITSTTVSQYLASHPDCYPVAGQSFQVGNQTALDYWYTWLGTLPGYLETVGPTDTTGTTTVTMPLAGNTEFHLREIITPGDAPSTYEFYGNNNYPEGAEFYCANDATNYDNFDFIRNPVAGQKYYCVGFNILMSDLNITLPTNPNSGTLVPTTPSLPYVTSPSSGSSSSGSSGTSSGSSGSGSSGSGSNNGNTGGNTGNNSSSSGSSTGGTSSGTSSTNGNTGNGSTGSSNGSGSGNSSNGNTGGGNSGNSSDNNGATTTGNTGTSSAGNTGTGVGGTTSSGGGTTIGDIIDSIGTTIGNIISSIGTTISNILSDGSSSSGSSTSTTSNNGNSSPGSSTTTSGSGNTNSSNTNGSPSSNNSSTTGNGNSNNGNSGSQSSSGSGSGSTTIGDIIDSIGTTIGNIINNIGSTISSIFSGEPSSPSSSSSTNSNASSPSNTPGLSNGSGSGNSGNNSSNQPGVGNTPGNQGPTEPPTGSVPGQSPAQSTQEQGIFSTGLLLPPALVNALDAIVSSISRIVTGIVSPFVPIISSIFNALGTPTGNFLSKVIGIVGIVTTALASLAMLGLANPDSLAELALLPFRFWNLLLIIFGVKKRNHPWGTVYDSVTKQPIDPAYVMLTDLQGNEIATSITDIDGRYGFSVPPGSYKIIANKTNFEFPSKKLAGSTGDELYNNLYFGDVIVVKEEGEIITKNIPMDQLNFDWNEFAKNEQKRLSYYRRSDVTIARIANFFFWLGFIIAIIAVLDAHTLYNSIIFLIYVLLFIIRQYSPQFKSKGTVTEALTDEPMPFAIIHVLSAATGQEITHKVTDRLGNYYCLVPNGTYNIVIDRKNADATYTKIAIPQTVVVKDGYLKDSFKI